jgi:GxxExxY protein
MGYLHGQILNCSGERFTFVSNENNMALVEEKLCNSILKCVYAVHTELGPGLLESAYQECLEYELKAEGLYFQRELEFPLMYKGLKTTTKYRLDFLVERKVILELKAVESMPPIFDAVLINYLKLMDCRVGFLINYHVIRLKDGIRRFVN